mgnify:FL=1|tara:strand:- start:821 stop:1546 length:726 start_codon:yes stop_codon:yes gene_type:complete
MDMVEISLIAIFCIIQSIFGVGLLLLGTPTFLLIGYEFFEVLNILLPYSIVISFIQIITNKNQNLKFCKKILTHSIPFLILGLIIIEHIQYKINIVLIVSFLLIIFPILNIKNLKKEKIKIKNINLFLNFLGLLHGLTNLGGSLLTIISSNLHNDKNIIRYNISSGYLIFALFQLLFINIFFNQIDINNLKFIWMPVIIYMLTQKFFKKMNDVSYYNSLNILILSYGIYMFIDSIYFYIVN